MTPAAALVMSDGQREALTALARSQAAAGSVAAAGRGSCSGSGPPHSGSHTHLVNSFTSSTDPRWEEKLIDVVGWSVDRPDSALVLCLDEKSPGRALDRSQPLLPVERGAGHRR